MTAAPNEVRVVCEHGPVTTFVASSIPGIWRINVQGAERVPYPDDGVERWHYSMRCDGCRLNVPVVDPDGYGPFLDRLVQTDSPAITRVSPTVVEIPLVVVAHAAGESWQLPE